MAATVQRNLTPPQVARRYGVATAKVRNWIESGELAALNLGNGATRPRYSIPPEALEQFERNRRVVPSDESTPRLRRQKRGDVPDFFLD